MPVGPGPRFVIEAVFIVGVAVVAAVSKLGNVGIILAIFAAWVVVAAVEWTASRQVKPAAAEGADEAATGSPRPRHATAPRARARADSGAPGGARLAADGGARTGRGARA